MLLAVSKTQPAATIAAAICCGQRHFGENYLQEALAKKLALESWLSQQSHVTQIYWHYIGNVQSNKTRDLATHFDWVHTVTSEKHLKRLNDQRPEHLSPLNVCLQINIDAEPQKQGISPSEALALCQATLTYSRLKLRGLMCLPEQGNARASFSALNDLMRQLQDQLGAQSATEGFDTLSMGMSGDMEEAIVAGSTVVRIGTALFGPRQTKD